MQVGDHVSAPPRNGTAFDPRVAATVIEQLPSRTDRDYSDGSSQTFRRYRVQYPDGSTADWDDSWVQPVES